MPRLLLVDDNPSIHKIAESLLAHSDIELVCTDGGAKALALLDEGQVFDVFLVDLSMAGMDGWQLLEALRGRPETRLRPVALMAGVLDLVDPARLADATAQDFLKKPVELKDLGDRIQRLLAMPVNLPEPPADAPVDEETAPGLGVPEVPEDLLLLTEEDLWIEPAAEPTMDLAPVAAAGFERAETPSDLSLEDLDFGLADASPLTVEDERSDLAPVPSGSEAPELTWEEVGQEPTPDLEAVEPRREAIQEAVLEDMLAAPGESLEVDELEVGLPVAGDALDLDEVSFEDGTGPLEAESAPGEVVTVDLGQEPESMVDADPAPMVEDRAEEVDGDVPVGSDLFEDEAQVATPVVPVAAGTVAAGVAEVGIPAGALHGRALVEAVLADPEALDLLARALAGRLSEQALKEVAWEVLPDLAERMRPY